MKKQLYTIAVIILIFNIQSISQTQFEPNLYAKFGYENNLFRAPDILELNEGTTLNASDLIISDSFLDLGYDLYLKHKIKKRHIFRIHQDLWNRRYTNKPTLNQFKTNLKFNYEYKISREMQIGIKYRFDLVNKIGTSVLGDELTQLFSYKRNHAELYYKYDILKNTEIDLRTSYCIKNYDKALGIIPLDYNSLGFNFGLSKKIKLKKAVLKPNLNLKYSTKTFSDIIASDVNGSELAANPTRVWNYYSGQFSMKGTFASGFELKPYVTYKKRHDTFEDYYSYNAISFGIGFAYKSDIFQINLTPEYQSLNYLVKTAPDPDASVNPGLVYNTIKVKLKTSYEIFNGVALTVEFRNRNRETNTIDLAWKTRRSYNYYEAIGGIIINPAAFFN